MCLREEDIAMLSDQHEQTLSLPSIIGHPRTMTVSSQPDEFVETHSEEYLFTPLG